MTKKRRKKTQRRRIVKAPVDAGKTPKGGRNAILLLAVVLCVGAGSFFLGRYFRRGEREPEKGKSEKESAEKRLAEVDLKLEESAKAYNERAVEVSQGLMKELPGLPEPIFLLGQVYHEQEKYDKAVTLWEDGLRIDSSRPDAYQAMGLMALEKGDYPSAISHWRKALKVDPDWPGARRAVGLALMHLGKLEEAVPELEEDLKSDPRNPQTNFLLGQISFQLKNYEKAKEYFEAAIEFYPSFSNAHYKLFQTLTKLGEDEAAKEPLEKFKELKAKERKAKREGEERYEDMIAQRGALARTYHRAAVIYATYDRGKEASYQFRAAVQLDPENADARLHFAVFCELEGKTEAAIRMYQEASRLRPQDFRPHLSLGVLYSQQSEYGKAEESLTKAIRFNPAFTVGYRELANLYMGPMKKLEEAEALARRAVHVDPSAANYDLLAWACYLNEKYDDAETASQTAVEMEPDNPLYRSHYDTIRSRE